MTVSHPLFIDSHNSKLEGDYLYGYCLSEDGHIYFGNDGWKERASYVESPSLDGLYVWVSKRNHCTRARTDITGQESIYYYCSSSYWAVSNSFYLLVCSLRSREINLTFNKSVMDCFLYNRGKHISAQLMSNNTLAMEIRLLPQNCELVISGLSGSYTSRETRYYDFLEHIPKNISNYARMMHDYANKQINFISSLCSLGYKLRVSLSGGYDSREIIAAMTLARTLNPEAEVEVFSEQSSHEYKFAEAVAKECGYDLRDRRNMYSGELSKVKLTANEAFNNWLIANGGTYTPVLIPTSLITESRNHVDLWGFVSYEWDYFLKSSALFDYAKPSIKSTQEIKNEILSSSFSEDQKIRITKEFDSYFEDIGVLSNIENAMDIYYMGTRSRHHYGRRWFKCAQNSGFQIGLLQFKEQILLNWFCAAQDFDKRQFHRDLLSILNPSLASLDFDSEWKRLSELNPTFSVDEESFINQTYTTHGISLDPPPHALSLFEYGRLLSSKDSLHSSEDDLGEIFRKVSNTALEDTGFRSYLPEDYIRDFNKEISTPIVDLPPEANNSLTLMANLYSVYSAINKKSAPKAKIKQPISLLLDHSDMSISAQIEIPIDKKNIEFAFYLLKRGERLQTIWYSPNSSCTFNLQEKYSPDEYEVIGFIRKINDQNVVYKRSKA